MPWPITNQQLDPMQFTLDDATVVQVAGLATANVNSGVASIIYHKLNYVRNGIWPFPANQALNASYGGEQNCYIQNPTTGTQAVYPYTAP